MEVGTELVSRIAAHAPSVGEHSTAIAGLILFRRTQATACYRAAVEPSLTVFVQGKKRISLGGIAYLCGPSSFSPRVGSHRGAFFHAAVAQRRSVRASPPATVRVLMAAADALQAVGA